MAKFIVQITFDSLRTAAIFISEILATKLGLVSKKSLPTLHLSYWILLLE